MIYVMSKRDINKRMKEMQALYPQSVLTNRAWGASLKLVNETIASALKFRQGWQLFVADEYVKFVKKD